MNHALSWQRLVKRRWTTPARQHAEKMRREAEQIARTFGPRAGSRDALLQGAAYLDRLADLLDELAKPEDDT